MLFFPILFVFLLYFFIFHFFLSLFLFLFRKYFIKHIKSPPLHRIQSCMIVQAYTYENSAEQRV